MIKIQENSKKRHFGPDLGLVDPNLGHQNFFIKLIDINPSYHSV